MGGFRGFRVLGVLGFRALGSLGSPFIHQYTTLSSGRFPEKVPRLFHGPLADTFVERFHRHLVRLEGLGFTVSKPRFSGSGFWGKELGS